MKNLGILKRLIFDVFEFPGKTTTSKYFATLPPSEIIISLTNSRCLVKGETLF